MRLSPGAERIFVAPTVGLTAATPYDVQQDITFFHDPAISSAVVLQSGDFAVFFAQDAHKTCCLAGDSGPVRKVVIKIRLPAAATLQ